MNKEIKWSHQRRNLRLPDFDYSMDGAYFVTIVTQQRKCLFGSVVNQAMVLNDAGRMVENVCEEIPFHLSGIELGTYQIMPNHFHAIIMLYQHVGATLRGCPGQAQRPAPTDMFEVYTPTLLSLPDVVHRFKSITTNRYMEGVRQSQWPKFEQRLWQRNYYEHVVRDEIDFQSITDYIQSNPANWDKNDEY